MDQDMQIEDIDKLSRQLIDLEDQMTTDQKLSAILEIQMLALQKEARLFSRQNLFTGVKLESKSRKENLS